MAFTGMNEALKAGPENNSPLYVFTDAPPKDATQDDLFEQVKEGAKFAGINVYFFTTGVCSPGSIKPFEDLARETCGHMFELPKSGSDLAKMKKVTKDLLGGTTCGSFDFGFPVIPGKKKRSVPISGYKLLVDDTMEKIIVSVSSEHSGAKIDLNDPLGNPTSDKTTLSKVTIFDVDHPMPGIWRLVVAPDAGKHTYMFKGSSHSNLDFDFIFVIPRQQRSPIPIPHPLTGEQFKSLFVT